MNLLISLHLEDIKSLTRFQAGPSTENHDLLNPNNASKAADGVDATFSSKPYIPEAPISYLTLEWLTSNHSDVVTTGPSATDDTNPLRSTSSSSKTTPSNTITPVVIRKKRSKTTKRHIQHYTLPCKLSFVTYCLEKCNKLNHEDTSIVNYAFDASQDPMWETKISNSYDNDLM